MDAMTQTPQELKKQLDDALQLVSQTVKEIGQNPESLIAPGNAGDVSRSGAAISAEARELFESLVARDEQMIQELMRLQRSLSRQSFRGAESARRLVRRLARRAQQSIAEVQSIMGLSDTSSKEDMGKNLASTLDRIRRELKRIKTMEADAASMGSQVAGPTEGTAPDARSLLDHS